MQAGQAAPDLAPHLGLERGDKGRRNELGGRVGAKRGVQQLRQHEPARQAQRLARARIGLAHLRAKRPQQPLLHAVDRDLGVYLLP